MLNTAFYLSLILALAGFTGLVLAGKGKWYGWAIGLAVQPVWVAFGIITKGYGLCLIALMYGYVYGRNLLSWRAKKISASVKNAGYNRRGRTSLLFFAFFSPMRGGLLC